MKRLIHILYVRTGTPPFGRGAARILALVLCAFLAGCQPFATHPKAQKGVLDLTAWNFDKDGPVKLDGEWEFYWQHLYTAADFSKDSLPTITGYIHVPGYWNFQDITTTRLPGSAIGTYRLRIKKGTADKLMGIKVLDQNSAYRLWINDQFIAGEGKVGTTAGEEEPRLMPVVKVFESTGDMQVIVQVSNFFAYRSGIGLSMSVGTQTELLKARDLSTILSMCLLGCFVILSIYHLFIFFLRRTEYIALWFGVLCFTLSVRSLLIDEKFLYELFPTLHANLGLRLEYESLWISGLFLGMFVQAFFPKEFSRSVLKVLIGLSVIELLIIFCTPSLFYTSLLICYQFKAIAELCYYFYVTVRAMRKRRQAATILFLFMIVLAVTGINDMLYSNLIINTTFLLSYGGFFILVAQAYLIAQRLSLAYNSVEKLSVELNSANINLEQKVVVRTRELETEKKIAEGERAKADDLLLNILPGKTAEELKTTGRSEPRSYSMVTVMFIDMVGFTRISEHIGAELLVAEIDACFSAFDHIVEECGVEKIKTIGDAYLCAAGLPVPNATHAEDTIKAALKMKQFMDRRQAEKELKGEVSFSIRIGINTGPLVAGIVGIKKFAYDIWGDTVNTAARMEQNSEPGRINISASTYELIKDKHHCTYRGKIEAKNKGMIDMYYVE